jgi:hypothetical protein
MTSRATLDTAVQILREACPDVIAVYLVEGASMSNDVVVNKAATIERCLKRVREEYDVLKTNGFQIEDT